MCTCMYIYICTLVCTYACMYVCAGVCTCMYVCMYVCIYTCKCSPFNLFVQGHCKNKIVKITNLMVSIHVVARI